MSMKLPHGAAGLDDLSEYSSAMFDSSAGGFLLPLLVGLAVFAFAALVIWTGVRLYSSRAQRALAGAADPGIEPAMTMAPSLPCEEGQPLDTA